jgi:hypothetical protein
MERCCDCCMASGSGMPRRALRDCPSDRCREHGALRYFGTLQPRSEHRHRSANQRHESVAVGLCRFCAAESDRQAWQLFAVGFFGSAGTCSSSTSCSTRRAEISLRRRPPEAKAVMSRAIAEVDETVAGAGFEQGGQMPSRPFALAVPRPGAGAHRQFLARNSPSAVSAAMTAEGMPCAGSVSRFKKIPKMVGRRI